MEHAEQTSVLIFPAAGLRALAVIKMSTKPHDPSPTDKQNMFLAADG